MLVFLFGLLCECIQTNIHTSNYTRQPGSVGQIHLQDAIPTNARPLTIGMLGGQNLHKQCPRSAARCRNPSSVFCVFRGRGRAPLTSTTPAPPGQHLAGNLLSTPTHPVTLLIGFLRGGGATWGLARDSRASLVLLRCVAVCGEARRGRRIVGPRPNRPMQNEPMSQ